MKESTIQTAIRIALNTGGTRAWRNNIAKLNVRGSWINYGIPGPGGSDLLGFHTITIEPHHVGTNIAVFLAVECKSPNGKPSSDQSKFIDFINQSGGIAGIARSVDDAVKLTKQHEP